MSRVDVVVSCEVPDSFRVRQVAGMFDVPLASRASERFDVEMPEADEPWRVGLIVGPSGSGKSTVARALFGSVAASGNWPENEAVIDVVGGKGVREASDWLMAAGLSSVPAWIKPFRALSTGEQFRCELARALARGETRAKAAEDATAADDGRSHVVVIDEFTSVVDREVARSASASVARAVRLRDAGLRVVAVTCHGDVEEWLEPDWTIDMGARRLYRRRLRRPAVEIGIWRTDRAAWRMFARHHYLTGALGQGAICYGAWWGEKPVGFCAVLAQPGRKNWRRISRIVTLPEFQGLGVGGRLLDGVAQLERAAGRRVSITASHPGICAHCARSRAWRCLGARVGTGSRRPYRRYRGAVGRSVRSFEFIGDGSERRSAESR